MTLDNEQYKPSDLISLIVDSDPDCYASQVGNLKSTLMGVLSHVKQYDPEMFQDIMEYEMKIQDYREARKERMKAIDFYGQ